MFRLLLVLVAIAPTDVFASSSCEKASTTIEINQCAKENLDRAEVVLNKTYKSVLARLAAIGKDEPEAAQARVELIAAQRLWVTFREADCNAIYTLWQTGSIRTVMHLSCMQDHSEQRNKELGAYLQEQ